MTFEEAVELARDATRKLRGVEVIALGRFLPVEDVRPDSPWGVSILLPGWVRPRLLNGPDDLDSMIPTLPKPAPVAASPRRSALEATPLLFD
jgi:hypothetical protein